MLKHLARLFVIHALILLAKVTRRWKTRIPIFVYHSIDDTGSPLSTSPENFLQRLAYLRKHAFVCLSAGNAIKSFGSQKYVSKPSVAITFDDAYESIASAIQAMAAQNASCTVFVPSRLLDQSNLWDRQREDVPQLAIMSVGQLKTLTGQNAEIGSHTCTHPHLPEICGQELAVELRDARNDLETLFETPIHLVAYPFGAYDTHVIEVARTHGYRAGLTTRLGYLKPGTDPMQIPRFPVDLDFLQFRLVVHGGYDWYRTLQDRLFGSS